MFGFTAHKLTIYAASFAFHACSSAHKQHPYTSLKYSNGFDINNSIIIKATIPNNANFLFITANKKKG